MIDVSDDGHVSDVLLLVHDLTDLVYRKIDHLGQSTRSLKRRTLLDKGESRSKKKYRK